MLRRCADHDRELLDAAVGRAKADDAGALGRRDRQPRLGDRAQGLGREVGIAGDGRGIDPGEAALDRHRLGPPGRRQRHGQSRGQQPGELGQGDRGGRAGRRWCALGARRRSLPGRIGQAAHRLELDRVRQPQAQDLIAIDRQVERRGSLRGQDQARAPRTQARQAGQALRAGGLGRLHQGGVGAILDQHELASTQPAYRVLDGPHAVGGTGIQA